MWVDVKNMLWVRKFKGGLQLFYKGCDYLHYELLFNTEVWDNGLKEFEYNAKFGAFDIETYSTKGLKGEGLQIPYAAGFTDYKGVPTVFYARKEEEEFLVLVRALQGLLCSKYTGGTFYVHNLARFDSRLILEALGKMDGVRCTLWGRDMCNIFKIRISKQVGKKSLNVVLLDSVYQLPFKLEVLGRKFDTKVKKTTFPYEFVNKETLFYKGVVPAKTYYRNKVSDTEYSELCKIP